MKRWGFVPSTVHWSRRPSLRVVKNICSRQHYQAGTSPRTTPYNCASKATNGSTEEVASTSSSDSPKDTANALLTVDQLETAVCGTMLEGKTLALAYSTDQDGFDNDMFFTRLAMLDGVPSLVTGVTEDGALFGAYTAHGFLGRDDYRDSSNERALFAFAVRDGQVVFAQSEDRMLYDFWDCAIRFGGGMLEIPMNPRKHVMKANVGRSSCRMPDGYGSLFGHSTMAPLRVVEVSVDQKYLGSDRKGKRSGGGLFGRLFG